MAADSLTINLTAIGILIVLTILSLALVHLAARYGLRTVGAVKDVPQERRQQYVTLVHVLKWGADVLIVVTALLMLLTLLGVNVTPLIAGAGVVGLAMSLGAQTFVKDIVGGLFILVENQYAIGDTIQVGDVVGEVERITMRATYVRAGNGDQVIVPNGEVRIVANQTKAWSRVRVDLGVGYEEDLDRALSVLEEAASAFAQDPLSGPHLLEPPQVLGVMSLGDSAVTVRVAVKTQPGRQWGVARELRKYLLATCEREGIALPYPRQEVWVRTEPA